MKRPSCRGSSSVVSQETQEQQEDPSSRYMEHQQGLVHDTMPSAYDEEEDEEDQEDQDELGAGGGGRGGLGEKKRRLAADQVRALERCFEADNKLDPERKARIARDLRLHPRQVAVWFQNRRARWKTKQIERDFAALRARHEALRNECDELRRDKDALAAEIRELRDKVEKQMAVKLESSATDQDRPLLPASAAGASAAAICYKQQDGSTDSDSSAVFNEEASPYSAGGAAFESFTGFTSFLVASSSSALSSSSFLPSMYAAGGPHLEAADGFLGGGADGFFAEEHGTGGLGGWYGGEGW